MILLDLLETQDLGKRHRDQSLQGNGGHRSATPTQERTPKPRGKLLWVSGWAALTFPLGADFAPIAKNRP